MLPAYRVNPMLDLSPISNALTGYQQQMNTNDQAQRQERSLQMREVEFDDARKQREAERIGRIAQMYLGETEPTRKQALGSGMLRLHPNMVSELRNAGIDTNNHDTVARFLLSQTGAYDPSAAQKSAADLDYKKAQSELARSQASFYRARGAAAMPSPAAAPSPQPDPLAGAGLDENGNIVTPSGQPAEPQSLIPGGVPMIPRMEDNGRPVPSGDRFKPPMRLGGPMDDIERSMRLDEGRPQGVRVAQAGGSATPAVPGIRPELMDQAISRFGTTGMTSPQVPGMVTDAGRNRRVDVPATREMQGQRAFNQATPEQQDRLMKFRQDQELWTGVYKRPPRAGYYYGEDGREMALTDKNFKGDRENQAVALMNWNKVDAASKKLLEYSLIPRATLGAGNIGEVGQAYADLRQGAIGIAYALSGKTVAVAEMNNFLDAYAPTPTDRADRIKWKVSRIQDFYQAMLTASRGGASYERAFADAMARIGLKNPDGSPAGAPAAASGGTRPQIQAPANDIRGLPTEELVRRLNGGR